MATGTGKGRCVTCGKEKRGARCEGCSQLFCFDHLNDHRQELSQQLDEIEMNRDVFRQTLTEQTANPKKNSLIKQIDQWERDSIRKIQQTANECREMVLRSTTGYIHQIEINLTKLTDELKEIRKENDFNEIDLNELKQKLTKLTKELDKPTNVSIQYGTESFINKVSVVTSSHQVASFTHINNNTRWKQNGITIAGGVGKGDQLNQLSEPGGIYLDDDDQCIYVADSKNNRVVQWKLGAKNIQVVAGGNGKGNRIDQLNSPRDMIVDKKSDSIIICDQDNQRVVRWPRQNGKSGETIISDIDCCRLILDNNGDLYVSDWKKDEVKRWKAGETNGTIVAGGNGRGDQLNQLNVPTSIFVDKDYSVYVSDWNNHRVMKWMKGAKEGIIVAGGQGKGNSLRQLSSPQGLVVDQVGSVYVVDGDNHRIMRWCEGSKEGSIVVGGNSAGQQSNQVNYAVGLSFDRESNLYVADWGNNRVLKFNIDLY